MPSPPGLPTYEQLRIFLAAVDAGSFAAAGRRLHRAVSVVSYSIANLEAQLGLQLFERRGTRRPRLTAAGQAVLPEVRAIGRGFDGLRAKVKDLLDGQEDEVSVAVDAMLPAERLSEVLRRFSVRYPDVCLRLHAAAFGAVTARVAERQAIVGISGPFGAASQDIECTPAGSLALVPVAAPFHPLARMERVAPGAAREHVRLVLAEPAPAPDAGTGPSPRIWSVGDLGVQRALLRDGMGWGDMPLTMVAADLEDGSLVRLALPDHGGETYRFAGVWRRDRPPGRAAAWLLQQFAEANADGQDEPDAP